MEYTRSEGNYAKIITFLWPVFGLFLSIRYYRRPFAKNVFWLFCAFTGGIFIYSPAGGTNSDSIRYAMSLEQMHAQATTLDNVVATFFSDSDKVSLDIYQPLVTFAVSRFTGNAHYLFFIFAVVFGFFYSRNIWFLIEHLQSKIPWSIGLVIIAFALCCPIWYINGMRMWTALHVFLYGLLPYLFNNDKSKLVWCYLALLFHFSFIFPAAVLTGFLFLPRNMTLFLLFYLICQTVSELNLGAINEYLNGLEVSAYESKINSYINEEYASGVNEALANKSAYIDYFFNAVKYGILAMNILLFFLLKRYRNSEKRLLRMFCFSLFFGGLASIVANVPSGSRFVTLSIMVSFAVFVFIRDSLSNKLLDKWFQVFSVFIVPYTLLNLRIGAYFFGFDVLIQNFISMLFLENNIPIDYFIESIK